MLRKLTVLLVTALALSVLGVGQNAVHADTTMVFYIDRDAELNESTPDNNLGKDNVMNMQVCSGQLPSSLRNRAICHIDFSGFPKYITIYGAKLWLYGQPPESGGPRTHGVHRVDPARSWLEYEVTWNSYRNGFLWTTPGGDYTAAPTGTVTVSKDVSRSWQWYGWDVTADVKAFINDEVPNNGWIVRDENEFSGGNFAMDYRQRKGSNSGYVALTYDPTGVTVTVFEARATAAGVRLTWNTANEDMIGGFNVLRAHGTDYVKTNEYPIPARGGATGTSYSHIDVKGKVGDSYMLEVIGLDGTNDRIGPIPVCASGVDEGHGLPVPSFLKAAPNPTSGPVIFAFGGTSSELRVYDVSGQLVRTLTGTKGAAGFTARWDRTDGAGRSVPPGVYFGQAGSQQVKLTSF